MLNPLKPCLKGVFTLMVLATLSALPTAYAQSTNDKPINVVIPFAPGGGTDVLTRMVMPKVADAAQIERARLVKRMFGRYQRSRDLVAMGAYSAGADPELDTALRVWPGIAAYLQQAPDDRVDRMTALGQLMTLGMDIQRGR